MSAMQRRKGASGELEVVKILRSFGFKSKRTAPLQSARIAALDIQGADVDGLPAHHLEVKRQETIKIEAWCRQAEGDAPQGEIPAVIWRRTRNPWRITVRLADYLMQQCELRDLRAEVHQLKQALGDTRREAKFSARANL